MVNILASFRNYNLPSFLHPCSSYKAEEAGLLPLVLQSCADTCWSHLVWLLWPQHLVL